MFHLPPIGHDGAPIPVPPHHIFGWRRQGAQLVFSFMGWAVLWFAVTVGGSILRTPRSLESLRNVVPVAAVLALGMATLLTFLFVATPLLAWPWNRREFGRRLERRVAQMSDTELEVELELARAERRDANDARARGLELWIQWLEAQQAVQIAPDTKREDRYLTLLPSRRKLAASTVCGAVPLAAGIWLLVLAVVGGDGGTGIEGFSGPNAVWVKAVIGGLLVVTTGVSLIEAFTVRVDLDANVIRKRAWWRVLWSVPRSDVAVEEDDSDTYRVLNRRTGETVGNLNLHHFENGQLLALIAELRRTG
jgi:hypothetical protein